MGAKCSNSDVLLFIDDDVIIGRNNFIERICSNMQALDFSCEAERYWSETNWEDYLNPNFTVNHIQRILKERSYKPVSIERNSGKRNYHDFTFIGNFGAIKKNGFDENYIG